MSLVICFYEPSFDKIYIEINLHDRIQGKYLVIALIICFLLGILLSLLANLLIGKLSKLKEESHFHLEEKEVKQKFNSGI